MASFRVSSTQRAIQQDQNGRPRIFNEAAVPPLEPGHVLIQTLAVALNPSDHKLLNNFPIPGAYLGLDFSGIVVRVASDVDSETLKPGTMVCAAASGFTPEHRTVNGAFAEYVRVRADMVLRVPSAASFSPQRRPVGPLEAATLGTALATCILAIWASDALALTGNPDTPNLTEKPVDVLVYGGSTATGTIAIQLLKLSGYNPIATCSPRNFDLVRKRGASAVFDYSSPDVAAKIKEHTNGRLKYVIDCISDTDSVAICYSAIQRPGGRYVSLELISEELLAKRRAVHATFVMAAEVQGSEIKLGADGYDRPADWEKHLMAVGYLRILQRLLDEGRLEAHPMHLLEGGLDGIMEGLEMLSTGGVPGKKLVAIVNKPEFDQYVDI